MPFEKIVLRPGVNTQATALLNEASWSASNLVRFFQGFLQKIGGWQRLISQTLTGTCRGIVAWADLTGNPYVACGTEQRLQVVVSGGLFDITPIRATHNVTVDFSTTIGSNIVTIKDTSNGAEINDGVDVVNPIAVGGIVIRGTYQILSIIDNDNYTVGAASNAASTISHGGVTAIFNTANTLSTVTVTLPSHGFSPGDLYTVYVSTTVATIVLFGDYIVQTVVDSDNFTITAASTANATTSGSENGGQSRLEYLLPSGLVSTGVNQGYGIGGYGLGPYGIGGTSSSPAPLRQWSLDPWGQQLLASPTQGALYFWDPTSGTFQNPAAIISAAPAQMAGFFVAMPQQQVVSYGATDPGTGAIDPMLVRWCDVADYTDWTASSTNQAGSYRIPRGSKIVGGMQGPQYGLLWTDLALWQQQYIQPPLVYGFNEIAAGCGLAALRARCILGTEIVWVSQNSFFQYINGGVQVMECPVWDIIFKNLNQSQIDKMTMGANTPFNEFFTFFPSLTGSGENDTYVKGNSDGSWDYGSLTRTAWTDQSVYGNPMGVDENFRIQQHETTADADGHSILSSATSGWFKLNDGQLFIFIERMIPDFVLSGNATINLTVYTADYPNDTPTVYGPYPVTSSTEYIIVRSRSRLARVQISSTADLGSFWRLGEMLYMATPSGRR